MIVSVGLIILLYYSPVFSYNCNPMIIRSGKDVLFNRTYSEYQSGFGDCETGDCWVGLETLHSETSSPKDLRFDFTLNGTRYFLKFDGFYILDEPSNYTLYFTRGSMKQYIGEVIDDGLDFHYEQGFTTFDHDGGGAICPPLSGNGGFWYLNCYRTNPTGLYYYSHETPIDSTGISWLNAPTPTTWTEHSATFYRIDVCDSVSYVFEESSGAVFTAYVTEGKGMENETYSYFEFYDESETTETIFGTIGSYHSNGINLYYLLFLFENAVTLEQKWYRANVSTCYHCCPVVAAEILPTENVTIVPGYESTGDCLEFGTTTNNCVYRVRFNMGYEGRVIAVSDAESMGSCGSIANNVQIYRFVVSPIYQCNGYYDYEEEVCSNGNGTCKNNGTCDCFDGFSGDFCEVTELPPELPPDLAPSGVDYFELMSGTETIVPNRYGVSECLTDEAIPSSRYGSSGFSYDNHLIYLFGGHGYDSNSHNLNQSGYLNDVWTYSVESNKWCFVSGNTSIDDNEDVDVSAGNFDPQNSISSRAYFGFFPSVVSFFVFGGEYKEGTTTLFKNDLWEFSIIGKEGNRNQWRRLKMNNDQLLDDYPSRRSGLCMNTNNPMSYSSFSYLFGGNPNTTEISEPNPFSNDLWRYDVMTNEFLLLRNNSDDAYSNNEIGNYYTTNEFNEDIQPPQRIGCACWTDSSTNDFFIFGGEMKTSYEIVDIFSPLNDVWIFNYTLNQWAYLTGGNNLTQNQFHPDSSLHEYHELNFPASRSGMIQFSNQLFFFSQYYGGSSNEVYFYGGMNRQVGLMYADMWAYSIQLNQFKFENGTSNTQSFNTENNEYLLGSRCFGVGVAVRNNLMFWIFGGKQFIESS